MTKRMLIDSTHAEETRVVVLDGNRLEEFDVETSTKHQLKGNIYLAKVVRVEPSLQAAFVEYGGNRHGFLAFGEIHPDYYQIPVADRKRLLEAQEQEAREEEEQADREAAGHPPQERSRSEDEDESEERPDSDNGENGVEASDPDHQPVIGGDDAAMPAVEHAEPGTTDIMVEPDEAATMFPEGENGDRENGAGADMAPEMDSSPAQALEMTSDTASAEAYDGNGDSERAAPEQIGGEHDTEDQQARRSTPRFLRHYKIQEVIRRRQILLVQVVKEERGSKGAALTTYISLAGRFSVLMPNSPRGGGISRKITSAADRRRLKEVTSELDLPRGMGLIVRTAGANRPKPEILRDCEYLLNQWDQIRDLTMKSMAPALIYEEASLIKRAIRDVYSRDVDDILVDGEQGWRAARDFMRMLMPTHARKVQLWKDPQPLFAKAQVEPLLEGMLAPTVQLKSGGYLVINQTEALVAIDVNSGRSTRERGIEETALRTNLEAADETARQLRLRDLAGLIVIDFIDMENRRNVASVERRLKEALKQDRARIQVGSISHFGLMEMSRQRLRPSLTETNFTICAHCGGTGHVRSTESAALATLRAIEEEGGKRRAAEIVVHCPSSVALYILNNKRQRLTEVEQRHAMLVVFVADDSLLPPALRIERVRAQTMTEAPLPVQQLAPPEPFEDPDEIEAAAEVETEAEETEDEEAAEAAAPAGETAEEREARRGRRRRRRRGRSREENGAAPPEGTAESRSESSGEIEAVAEAEPSEEKRGEAEATPAETEASGGDSEEQQRRRRGRRGGRRRRREPGEGGVVGTAESGEPVEDDEVEPPPPPVIGYTGPTPANPFAGADAFDIFAAIEQAEEARAAAPRQAPVESPVPAMAAQPEIKAAPAVEEPAVAASAVTPVSEPTPEAPVEAHVEAPVETPVEAPAAAPVVAPLIQPVLVGGETTQTEKKRGWWRR